MGRRRDTGGPDGLVVIDKPAEWTSHDVVAKLRGVLGTRRVGHSGTLDPGATGVLLVGVGRVTRLLRFLTALPKAYTCEVVFGIETDTLDADGVVTATHDMSGLTAASVRAASLGLVGDILQVPPMVSAVKIDGKRLHELARAGEEVERPPRPVTVHSLTVEPTADPLVYRMDVECSSGTYVRTLAADLGASLGGGAHLRALRRTRIGSFGLDEAVPFTKETTVEAIPVLTALAALRDYESVIVDADVEVAVGHGKVLERSVLGLPPAGDGPWVVASGDGRLLAVYEPKGELVKPSVVVPPPEAPG
jgi:tRNA pseudouridine55 synthase